jgi:hypothetical protein
MNHPHCERCGTELSIYAVVCPKCGRHAASVAPPPAPSAPNLHPHSETVQEKFERIASALPPKKGA